MREYRAERARLQPEEDEADEGGARLLLDSCVLKAKLLPAREENTP
jgi:hypothetical protein